MYLNKILFVCHYTSCNVPGRNVDTWHMAHFILRMPISLCSTGDASFLEGKIDLIYGESISISELLQLQELRR